MRVVVYGVGAIGGTVAAALAKTGMPVVGIARGAQLAALQAGPLVLEHPDGVLRQQIDCVGDPAEVGLGPDDVILLAMKTQHTAAALDRLAAAGLRDQPVFCMQNGISNEPMALRYAPNVHGIAVMMPAGLPEPGRVQVFVRPAFGLFDIGRFPGGHDAEDARLVSALSDANIPSTVCDDVMAVKRGKLLLNLGNVIEAALGPEADRGAFYRPVRDEAEAVLRAAGLSWVTVDADDPRRKQIQRAPIAGQARDGGSTTQSLARGAGSVETAYLNGEIAAIARLNGQDAPLNAALTRLGAHLAASGARPGAMSSADLRAWLGT